MSEAKGWVVEGEERTLHVDRKDLELDDIDSTYHIWSRDVGLSAGLSAGEVPQRIQLHRMPSAFGEVVELFQLVGGTVGGEAQVAGLEYASEWNRLYIWED